MRNIRLHLEYDGEEFMGWQRQPGRPTIQALLEDLLEQVLERKTIVYGSSRTDSGVHARMQIANFYVPMENVIPPERWSLVLNSRLPRTVRVLESREVPAHFHSQKRVRTKVYEYRILNRLTASALDRRVLFYPRKLDWDAITAALPYFVGRHDFKSFQGAKSQVKTTVRTLYRFDLFVESGGLYRFEVEGSGFLKQMVRTIMGTVLEVGEGKLAPAAIPAIIASRDRNQAGRTAPASGLCLLRIEYDEE